MLREGYIKFNLQTIDRYNKRIENKHNKNIKKVNELKEAYLKKANSIKQDSEKIIKEKDIEIEKLNRQMEFLKKQKECMISDLDIIPQEIIKKYNSI